MSGDLHAARVRSDDDLIIAALLGEAGRLKRTAESRKSAGRHLADYRQVLRTESHRLFQIARERAAQ